MFGWELFEEHTRMRAWTTHARLDRRPLRLLRVEHLDRVQIIIATTAADNEESSTLRLYKCVFMT